MTGDQPGRATYWPCGAPRRPAPVKWHDMATYLASVPPHALDLTIADYWKPRGYGL